MYYQYVKAINNDETFRLFAKPSCVANLNHTLDINSTIKAPDLRYKLGDSDATSLTAWTYGAALPRVAVATPPTYNTGSPGLSANDDSCDFNASDYYQCGDTTTGNVGTNDIVAKVVFETTGTTSVIAAKRNAGVGWEIGIDASDRLYLTVQDAGGATTVVSAVLTSGRWVCGDIYADRSGSAQIYINKTASGAAVDISSRSGTLDSATALTIGADSGGAGNYDKRVAFFSLYSGAAWLDTHLQAAQAVKSHLLWSGHWPQIAAGTKAPTTSTRACPAYLDKVESGYRKLYYMGANHLRMCHRQDSNGVNVRGYLSETEATNLFTYSEDFSTWDLIEAGTVVVDNAEVCPDGRTVMASIAGDSDDEQHGIEDVVTLTAATYAYSGFSKPGDKGWIYVNNSTVANCDCYFDVTNGVKGTAGAGCVGYIEPNPWLNDSYRWCIVFTGTVAAHTLQVSPAVADGDNDFVGDGSTVNTYIWGAQVELGDYMTSPIRTAGATATRLKDNLQFVAGDNIGGEDVGKGSIYADVLFSDYAGTTNRRTVTLTDGADTGNRLGLYVDTSDLVSFYSSADEGNAGSSSALGLASNGVVQKHGATWETDLATAYRDGIPDSSPDTDCGMPNDIDTIHVGQFFAVQQLNGLLQNLRIFKKPVKSG